MNNNIPVTAATEAPFDDDEIDFGQIIDTLYDGRRLILAIAAAITVLGGTYAFMAKPVYEANILVQVEEANNAGNMLSQVAPLLEGKTASTAEIEIIRSRMIVSRAVDNLRLYIQVQPVQVPLIGGWASRRATGLSEPGFLGMGGYVWGTEKIEVSLFNVPDALTGERFRVTQGQGKAFTLTPPEGPALQGETGKLNTWATPKGTLELQIPQIQAKPGAQFEVVRNSRLAIIERLQTSIQISEKGKQSGIIDARLEGGDPVAIAAVLNAVGKEYVRQNIDRKAEEAGNTLQFLDNLLPQIRKDLEASESRYNQFRNTSGTVNLTAEGEALLGQAVTAQSQLLELRQKREELVSRFTPAHPSVQALDRQLADAQALAGRVTQQSSKLPQLEQETIRLTRDVKVNNELYASLLNNAQRLKLVKAGQVGSVRLLDPAVAPEKPVKPARAVIALVSLLLGLLAGVGAVYARKLLHAGIGDPNLIERRLGLTVYATIPHSDRQAGIYKALKGSKGSKGTRHPSGKVGVAALLSTQDNADPAIESLRSLRTALQFAMLDATNNIVMVTGGTPGLGKSFISVNFASVLAAGGKRVLLIDADLRKGYLHEYFGLSRGLGLTDIITGGQTPATAIHHQLLGHLDFLSTGPLPPNPADLLMNERLPALLKTLSAQYDHILIDSPPALVVSDAAVLGRMVGATFLVAREGVSTLGEVEEAHKRLAQSGVHVKGVLFNDLQVRPSRYGSKYSYRYSHERYVQNSKA